MAYVLEAVIAADPVVSFAEHYWGSATVAPLRQGLSIVPMTDDLFDEVSDGSLEGPPGFWRFPGGFSRVLCDWSSHGRVAYVEAEYFGGIGRQCSAVWDGGTIMFGPVAADDDEPEPAAPDTPISRALALLGVARGGSHDEFAAAGLGLHRRTADWR
jgi:hypothetical protein